MKKRVCLLMMALWVIVPSTFAYDFSAVAPTGQTLYYKVLLGGKVQLTYQPTYPNNNPSLSGNLEIPESVTYGGTTFSVTSIGDWAFYKCSGLTSVIIPNSVTAIGGDSFSGCSGLTSVTIGNSVTLIGGTAFYNCSSLTTVAFNADSCTAVPGDILSNCSSITNFTFGDNVKVIPSNLCKGLFGLNSVSIPGSVTCIGEKAFYNCCGLTSLYIPNSVTHINGEAFKYCSNLTSVTLGCGVTSIGASAFSQCDHIIQITSLATVPPTAANDAFDGVSYSIPLYVPTASVSTYQAAPVWNMFTNYIGIVPYTITASSDNPAMGTVTGGGTYAEGATVTITAIPNTGYHFVQWQDGNTQNPRIVTVTGNATYTATFAQSGTATVTATISQVTATSAHLDIVMGQYTSSFIYLCGPHYLFVQNGLTTGEDILNYVNQNYGLSDRDYNNVSGYINDLIPNTTFWLWVVPYNSDNVAGTIIWKQFTTLNANGIENVEEDTYTVSGLDGRLTVNGTIGELVQVYSVDGRCVYSSHVIGTTEIDVPSLGAYLIKIGDLPARRVVVVR